MAAPEPRGADFDGATGTPDHAPVPSGAWGRHLPMAMLAVWVAVPMVLGLLRGASGPGSEEDRTRLLIEGAGAVRQAYWARQIEGLSAAPDTLPGGTRDALSQMRSLARSENSPRAWRLYALSAYLLGVGDWRAHLAAIRDATPRRPVALVDRELAQWRAALEPDALLGRPIGERRRTAARAATFVRSMSLGWIRHPVLAEIYARHGLTREASQHRADAMRSVNRITLGAVLFILAALGGLALWCMGGFALAIIGRPSIMRHVAGLPALPPMLSRALAIAAASYFAGIVAVRFAVGLLPERAIAWLSADAATTARFGLSSAIAVLALVPPLVVLRRSGVGHLPTWQAIGLVRTRPFRDMAVGLSGYMAVLPPLIVTVLISMRLFSESESRMNPAVVDFVASPSIWPRLMLLLAGSVVAPLTEELVFRGILVRALQANLGVLGAIVVSSAIFAVLHPQLPMGFLSIFVLGLAFSALYWLTGSLWPSIIAHAVNNTIVFGYLALMLSD